MADTIEPRMSNATRSSARVVGTTRIMPTQATAASAAVRTKTEPQANCSSSAPDARMPRVPPAPAKPAQMPTALARSSGGNTLVMVDSVPGMSSAAPIPMSARSAMSSLGEPASADSPAATPKMAVPAMSAPRRPKRSPTAPAGSRSAARVSA